MTSFLSAATPFLSAATPFLDLGLKLWRFVARRKATLLLVYPIWFQ